MQAARAAAVASLLLTASNVVFAATAIPVLKYVQTDNAVLRAGPDEDFYVTQSLRWGARVEVYQQENGWSAIRPPEGSFSWVQEAAIQPTADPSVGLVVSDGVFTHVGSIDNDRRDAEYVQLKRGERVELLGIETTSDSSTATKRWYKIAPPSGEFRWIESAALADAPVRKPVASSAHRPRLTSKTLPASSTEPARMDPATTFTQARPIGSGIRTEPISSAGGDPQPIAPALAARAANVNELLPVNSWTSRTEAELSLNPVSLASFPKIVRPPSRASGAAALSTVGTSILDQLADLSIELSAMVADDIANWELDFVRSQTQYLLSEELTPTERDRASTLLDRIDRFSDVKLRYDHLQNVTMKVAENSPSTTSSSDLTQPARLPLTRSRAIQMLSRAVGSIGDTSRPNNIRQTSYAVPSSNSPSPELVTPQSSPYVGSGHLMPVYTTRSDLPRYALTDEAGRISAFVSPKSGLNVNRYLRHQVGIVGEESHINRTGSPHLLAERVVVLDRLH